MLRKQAGQAHSQDFMNLLDTAWIYIVALEEADETYGKAILSTLEYARPVFSSEEKQSKNLEIALGTWLPLLEDAVARLSDQPIIKPKDDRTPQPISSLVFLIRMFIVRQMLAGDGSLSDFLEPLDLAWAYVKVLDEAGDAIMAQVECLRPLLEIIGNQVDFTVYAVCAWVKPLEHAVERLNSRLLISADRIVFDEHNIQVTYNKPPQNTTARLSLLDPQTIYNSIDPRNMCAEPSSTRFEDLTSEQQEYFRKSNKCGPCLRWRTKCNAPEAQSPCKPCEQGGSKCKVKSPEDVIQCERIKDKIKQNKSKKRKLDSLAIVTSSPGAMNRPTPEPFTSPASVTSKEKAWLWTQTAATTMSEILWKNPSAYDECVRHLTMDGRRGPTRDGVQKHWKLLITCMTAGYFPWGNEESLSRHKHGPDALAWDPNKTYLHDIFAKYVDERSVTPEQLFAKLKQEHKDVRFTIIVVRELLDYWDCFKLCDQSLDYVHIVHASVE